MKADFMNQFDKTNEENTEEFIKMLLSIKELGKSFEAYDVKIKTNNTDNVISTHFHHEHIVMSAILESFYKKDELNFKELNTEIINSIPKDFIWDIPISFIQNVILKMIRIGLLEGRITENKYLPIFRITDVGVHILRQHLFQNLAASSFFSYQTLKLNKRSIRMNIYMLIVTIMSVIVTIWAIVNK